MNYYTDKTVEDALASAAAEKGCDLEDLKYFVKEEKKGILGIGSSVTLVLTQWKMLKNSYLII